MRPTPIHPWTPGCLAPARLRPGPRDASHERVERPKALRELAEAHGVRWYRDACGDDYIPGRWGEVFRLCIGRVGVQLGGPRANGTMTNVPEGSNTRINAVTRRTGWPLSQRADGETIFAVPEEALKETLRVIGAYRMPRGGTPPEGRRFQSRTGRERRFAPGESGSVWAQEAPIAAEGLRR